MNEKLSDPIALTRAFFELWNEGRINDAVAMLDEDVVYDVVSLPDIHGRRAVEEFHRAFGIGRLYTVDWQIKLIAAVGDVVLTERVDTFRHRSGKSVVLPLMGTLTVVDGFITVWRDYFDHAQLEAQMSAAEA